MFFKPTFTSKIFHRYNRTFFTLFIRFLFNFIRFLESNSTFSKEIKEVELNKSKNVIHNNTSIQRNSYEDSLSVEESTNKARFITDNGILSRKNKKTYEEVVESGNSNINEGKKCGKNCTIPETSKMH